MAHSNSALKRVRQAAKANLRNRSEKSKIMTINKKFLAVVAEGEKGAAEQVFRTFSSTLDKAAKKGVIKPNTASRKKSRAAARLAAMTK